MTQLSICLIGASDEGRTYGSGAEAHSKRRPRRQLSNEVCCGSADVTFLESAVCITPESRHHPIQPLLHLIARRVRRRSLVVEHRAGWRYADNCLILVKNRSTRLRPRYRYGPKQIGSFRLRFGGILAHASIEAGLKL